MVNGALSVDDLAAAVVSVESAFSVLRGKEQVPSYAGSGEALRDAQKVRACIDAYLGVLSGLSGSTPISKLPAELGEQIRTLQSRVDVASSYVIEKYPTVRDVLEPL